jgi:hypothetical protein
MPGTTQTINFRQIKSIGGSCRIFRHNFSIFEYIDQKTLFTVIHHI